MWPKKKENGKPSRSFHKQTRAHRHHWSSPFHSSCSTSSSQHHDPYSLQPAPSDMLSGLMLEDAILYNATRKVMNPPDKQLFMGLLAGIWVGLGGITALSVAGGVPEDVRARWISLPKFLNGAFFAFALHFIVMFGGELFTGNTMILSIGFYNRFVTLKAIAFNLLLVYIGNWCGCLLIAYFLGYLTNLFHYPQYHTYLTSIVHSKLEELNWGQIFLRAIPANLMVCLAFMLGTAARGAAGKILALWFPVVMFVVCGFEHCVANMFFVSIGLMYGAPSTIGRLWYNQSAALLGNLVGGAVFVGLSAHLMNHWKSPIFNRGEGSSGTLLGQDMESTRRARDVRCDCDDLEAGLGGVREGGDSTTVNGDAPRSSGVVEEKR